jgi:uncharacterized membrane protein
MAEVSENAKYLLFGYGPRLHALMALVANLFGIVTVILGVVSAATRSSIGFDTSTGFLLTIVFFILGTHILVERVLRSEGGIKQIGRSTHRARIGRAVRCPYATGRRVGRRIIPEG